MTPRRQRIDWIKYLIDTEGFAVRDFLLTAPRARPPKRERRRRQIAQMLCRYGLSAHDLVSELPPSPAPAAEKLHRAPIGDAS